MKFVKYHQWQEAKQANVIWEPVVYFHCFFNSFTAMSKLRMGLNSRAGQFGKVKSIRFNVFSILFTDALIIRYITHRTLI